MATVLIAPPIALAVPIEAARAVARVNGDYMDVELEQLIRTYAGKAEHETNRAIMEQTWELTLDQFPVGANGAGSFCLPHPPLVSVAHIKFYDVDGLLQTLDPQDYQVDTKSEPGEIVPAPGKSWPATAARINAVEVQFKCGYTTATVPDGIKGYVLRKIREEVTGVAMADTDSLLWCSKVFL